MTRYTPAPPLGQASVEQSGRRCRTLCKLVKGHSTDDKNVKKITLNDSSSSGSWKQLEIDRAELKACVFKQVLLEIDQQVSGPATAWQLIEIGLLKSRPIALLPKACY